MALLAVVTGVTIVDLNAGASQAAPAQMSLPVPSATATTTTPTSPSSAGSSASNTGPASPATALGCADAAPTYFANLSTEQKGGRYWLGPSLIPPGLKPGAATTPAQTEQVRQELWSRACQDEALARVILATLEPRSNLRSTPHSVVLARLRPYIGRLQLKYLAPPSGSWDYLTVPYYYKGGRPAILPAPYRFVGRDWFAVADVSGRQVLLHLRTGGRGVATQRYLNQTIFDA